MDSQQILSADYLDIVFQNHNKKYGGYELRKHYSSRANKALLLVLFSGCSLAAILFFHKNNIELAPPQPHGPITLTDPRTFVFPNKPDYAAPKTATKVVKQPTRIFEIEKDEKVLPKETKPEIADLPNKQIGTETTSGSSQSNTSFSGTSNEKTNTEAPPAISQPLRYASIMPEFNGTLNEFLQTHLKYPSLAKENNIEGKVIVEFIVNEDGSISNAVVKKGIGGGCNEEALRVINSMPRWKPGKQNDKPVKVFLVLPIIFQLQ